MAEQKDFHIKFRVWHIPQVPGPVFYVEVSTYANALLIQNTLADYDLFQYQNKIKGDYANTSGIQVYQHDITDQELKEMELQDRWVDIEDVDELNEYLDHIRSTGWNIVLGVTK